RSPIPRRSGPSTSGIPTSPSTGRRSASRGRGDDRNDRARPPHRRRRRRRRGVGGARLCHSVVRTSVSRRGGGTRADLPEGGRPGPVGGVRGFDGGRRGGAYHHGRGRSFPPGRGDRDPPDAGTGHRGRDRWRPQPDAGGARLQRGSPGPVSPVRDGTGGG